jgi:phosphoglycolate phosphatase-like HAD superfamily hydrolase
MPLLQIADTTAQVDLVVFDKDGTLIDFHRVWGPRMMRAAVALAAATGGGSELIGHLCRAVGYDHEQALVLGQGPLATAPHDQLESVVVTALFQSGQPWDRACALAREYLTPLMTAELGAAEIAPRADLHQTLATLTHCGTRLSDRYH